MSKRVSLYVSRETAALSVGANEVLQALLEEGKTRGVQFDVTKTGSRGLAFLEPLVEFGDKRIGFGPLTVEDIPDLLEAGLEEATSHPKYLGPVEELDYLKKQTRLVFANLGKSDPLDYERYEADGGFAPWERACAMSADEIIAEVKASDLRGRGGAGFPAAIKMQTVRGAPGEEKFVVCNADEGDAGTFSDRLMMEGDPFTLIQGVLIAARATGASSGYIYLRSEYPLAARLLGDALEIARGRNLLGPKARGFVSGFDIALRIGAGSYVCGEETAMLESLEGKRGEVRVKPPLPAHEGLFGKPTLVNNVITLAILPWILANGGAAFAAYGVGTSRGTLPVQLGGNVKRGGLVEVPFGISLRELVYDFGGGTRSGRPVRAIQLGGPLGSYLPESALDLPLDIEAAAAAGGSVGHGGIIVFDDSVQMAKLARFAFQFCAVESCGKCTPCRIGSVRGVEVMNKIIAGENREENLALIEDLCETLTEGSLCAMGGLTPGPVLSALKHFPEDFK